MNKTLEIEITSGGGGLLPIRRGSRQRTPMAFTAKITPMDPALPICTLVIERWRPNRRSGNPPEVVAVLLQSRPGAPPLDSTNVRIPIRRYFDEAIAAASAKYGDGDQEPAPAWTGTRGRRITHEQLQQVADIYRRAVNNGKPPLRELEHTLGVAYSSAARLVGQARDAGLLGPPLRLGVAGESDQP